MMLSRFSYFNVSLDSLTRNPARGRTKVFMAFEPTYTTLMLKTRPLKAR